MDSHRLAEERSIALHAEVARRLRDNPALLKTVSRRVDDWLSAGLLHPRYAAAWKEILSRPLEEICEVLVDPSEEARALRQSTPFVGILDATSRWRIWRAVGREAIR